MKKILSTIILSSFFFSGTGYAAEDDLITYYVSARGMKSCGDFMESLKKQRPNMAINSKEGSFFSESSLFIEWAHGYLSMLNLARAAQSPSEKSLELSTGTITTWLERFCAKNAQVSFEQAIWKLSSNSK